MKFSRWIQPTLRDNEKKPLTPSDLDHQNPLLLQVQNSALTNFLLSKGKTLLYTIGFIVAFVVIIQQYNLANRKKAELKYLKINQMIEEIQKLSYNQERELILDKITQIQNIFNQYPEFKDHYYGKMAQVLMQSNQKKLANTFFISALSRGVLDPNLEDFSKTSFLIEEEKWPIALEQTHLLQKKLEKSLSTIALINQMRLIALYHQLDNQEKELQEIENFLTKLPENSSIRAIFQKGGVSLEEYFQKRIKILKKINS